MGEYQIQFPLQKKSVRVPERTLLSEAIDQAGIPFPLPCGGHGSCGKCKAETENEAGERREVQACQYPIDEALKVYIREEQGQVLEEGAAAGTEWQPDFRGGAVTAFDIGTTSVAGYLLDAATGKQLTSTGRFNPQRSFGADVISRASHEAETRDGKQTQLIRAAIDEMLGELCEKGGCTRSDLHRITLVGNTCMHHLFLGLPVDSLLRVPYEPVMWDAFEGKAADYGLHMSEDAKLQVLPNIAGFVGADTVGCLVATDFIHEMMRTLMIDIGTNGELVMGTKEKAYACSTAAGPALEGAKISCGMCGIEGAIQHLKVNGEELEISVIGGGEATGICGSGLVDAIALLFREGLIEKRGRITKPEKLKTEFGKANAWRIQKVDGKSQIQLTEAVSITQQDIREVQLAKSAIFSGIAILCRKLGWDLTDLEQILVAGAFGNYMDPDSACAIGLLPAACREKIRGIGNAAGEGAKRVLAGDLYWEQAKTLARQIEFVELASEADFQTQFIRNLDFA